jgi:Tol biopolymer transport system component
MITVKRLIALASAAGLIILGVVAVTGPADAKVFGRNGQIVFSRFNSSLDDFVTFILRDGVHEQQLFPGASEFPHWSPDGSQVVLLAACPDGTDQCAAWIVDPDTGSAHPLQDADPTFFEACFIWSPDAERLACDGEGRTDPSRNGIYTIRSSDGGGLTRVTSNPAGGSDFPMDYSPSGGQLLFTRTDPSRPANANAALFIVNRDGSGLRRITSWGFPDADDGGSWSPDGRWILFSGRGEGGSLYVVHPDGTGLAKIPLETPSFSRAHDPSWSPDGTKIIFNLFTATSPGTEQEGIYTANADGTNVQQITSNPEFRDNYPDWGPHPLAT